MPYPKTPPDIVAAIHNYVSDDEDLLAVLAPAFEQTVPMETIYAAYDGLTAYPAPDGFDPVQLDVAARRILAGCALLIHQFSLTHRAQGALDVLVAIAPFLPKKEVTDEPVDADAEPTESPAAEGASRADAAIAETPAEN